MPHISTSLPAGGHAWLPAVLSLFQYPPIDANYGALHEHKAAPTLLGNSWRPSRFNPTHSFLAAGVFSQQFPAPVCRLLTDAFNEGGRGGKQKMSQ